MQVKVHYSAIEETYQNVTQVVVSPTGITCVNDGQVIHVDIKDILFFTIQ